MTTYVDTERLILREILPEDETALFELDSDPEVHEYLGMRPVETIEQIRMVINFIRQQYDDNGIGRWAVIEKSTNQFVGWAGLKLITDEVNEHINFYELGYRFMKKHWSKGFATEASIGIIKYGFDDMKLADIYAMTDPANLRSKKVLEKAGLTFVETFDFSGETTDWFRISK